MKKNPPYIFENLQTAVQLETEMGYDVIRMVSQVSWSPLKKTQIKLSHVVVSFAAQAEVYTHY